MVAKQSHKAILKKLEMRVRMMQKKEDKAKAELRTVIKKMRTQALTCMQVAAELESKVLKGIEAKSAAFASAVAKIKKGHSGSISPTLLKKSKQIKKSVRVTKKT